MRKTLLDFYFFYFLQGGGQFSKAGLTREVELVSARQIKTVDVGNK